MSIAARLGELTSRHYKLVTIVAIVTAVLLTAGAARLSFTADFRAYFSDDNPQLIAFEALEADFNKRDTLTLLIEPVSGDIYQPRVIELIRTLTDIAWQLPYARRVDSLANFQRLDATEDGISVSDLAGDEVALTAEALASIRAYVNQEAAIQGLLAAQDGQAAAVQVALILPDNSPAATRELLDTVEARLASVEADYSDVARIRVFGSTAINLALEDAVAQDMSLLIPLSTLLIYVLVWLLLRSIPGLIVVMTTISLSVAIVFGLFGWFGQPLSPASGMVPSMIMVIAVADCIHLLVTFYHRMAEGEERAAAVREALRINFSPMLITSVTTAVGLLCLNFSEAPPYRAMGNMGALGAMVAFLLTITLVPAMLCWLPAGKAGSDKGSSRLFAPMANLADWLIRHRYMAMVLSALAVLLLATGLPKNQLTERWHQYYDDTFAVRQALDFQNQHLNGVNFIEYRITHSGDGDVNDPVFIAELHQLHQWLREQPGVEHVDSILPRLKKVHELLETGSDTPTGLPQSRERAAQNMLLYELSLPMGLGTEEYVSADRQSIRMTVYLGKSDSRSLMHFDDRVQAFDADSLPTLQVSEGTGLDMVFAHISDRNMVSLLQGTALALVLISALLMVILKSFTVGLISLVPNLVPAIAAYGFWGYTVGYVDLGLSVVACMSLGLVVDDTVHFLSKYQRARRELDQTPEQAVRYAFSTVGAAMLVTTIVLALGFAVLVFSHFSPTWGMGGLLSSTILFALIFDFLLLPPLLLILDRRPG